MSALFTRLLQSLRQDLPAFEKARNITDPFGSPLPIGTYLFKFRSAELTEVSGGTGKPKVPCFIFKYEVIGVIESEEDPIGQVHSDQRRLARTEKSTVEECWGRVMLGFQALGVNTKLIIFEECDRTNENQYTIEDVIESVNTNHIYLKGTIVSSPKDENGRSYTNLNKTSLVGNAEVAEILGHTDFPSSALDVIDEVVTNSPVDENLNVIDESIEGLGEEVDEPIEGLEETEYVPLIEEEIIHIPDPVPAPVTKPPTPQNTPSKPSPATLPTRVGVKGKMITKK